MATNRSTALSANWRQALDAWQAAAREEEARRRAARPKLAGKVPVGWWVAAFENPPSPSEERGHRCGEREMLTIVAYDIREPKRLHAVAKHCEDFGVRVQYSVFECRLEADLFARFWERLVAILDLDEDRVVAYKVCARCAQAIQAAGVMEGTEKVVAYVV